MVPTRRPYCVVVHTPSCRAFTLDRSYSLIGETDQALQLIAQYGQTGDWQGWRPTQANQQPHWALDLPDSEFTAVWLPEAPRVRQLIDANALAAAAVRGFDG